MARKTSYRKEYADLAFKFALLGATDVQMSDFFGISKDTFYHWKEKHPRFSDSITRGKARADAEVASRLYQRAIGYTHPEEKLFQNNGEVVRADTIRHYPPETQAASLWLRNRQPALWRDKREYNEVDPERVAEAIRAALNEIEDATHSEMD